MALYKCIYCKVQYDHDSSYKHNAYDCPKQKGKRMKAGMVAGLVCALIGLTGCEAIQSLLPKDSYPVDTDRAELQFYKGDRVFKYICKVNVDTKALIDCREVN